MTRFRTLIGLGLASTMMVTAPVLASTPQHSAVTAAKSTSRAPAKQSTAMLTPAQAASARTASGRTAPRLAKATLSNGKKVTYNCNLAANKNKQACKG